MAATFAQRGLNVIGVDIDPEKVAKVNAGLPPGPKAQREHFLDRHPQSPELGVQAADCRARANGVGQNPAADASLNSAAQRLDNRGGRLVVFEDVEQQMDVAFRLVNINRQTVDHPLIVHYQLDSITAQDRALAKFFC